MEYKDETIKTYNLDSKIFEDKFENFFKEIVMPKTKKFMSLMNGKSILDLGSGPGVHAKFFQEKGFDVLCIDLSEEMVKLCKQKGLKAEVGDIEDLHLNQKFDGVWAHTSFLHVPRIKFAEVFSRASNFLKEGGIFFICLKEGVGEEMEEKKYSGKRFFSYFMDKELREIFSEKFIIKDFWKARKGNTVYLNYLMSRI